MNNYKTVYITIKIMVRDRYENITVMKLEKIFKLDYIPVIGMMVIDNDVKFELNSVNHNLNTNIYYVESFIIGASQHKVVTTYRGDYYAACKNIIDEYIKNGWKEVSS